MIHTYDAPCGSLVRVSAPDARKALTSLFAFVARLAARPRDAVRLHLAMRRIARFSVHRLDDIGFERDWDGTIRPRSVAASRGEEK
jgi:hypothetical protein